VNIQLVAFFLIPYLWNKIIFMKKVWRIILRVFFVIACKFSKHNKNENIDIERKEKK